MKTIAVRLFTLLIFTVHIIFLQAQDSLCLKKFEQRTLFDFGDGFQINGRGIGNKELKSLLNKYSDASAEFLLYWKKRRVSKIAVWGTVSLAIAGSIIHKSNKALGDAFMIAGTSLFVIDFPLFLLSGKKHFQKSVWLYNKNVMAY